MTDAVGFSADERALLLTVKGVGPTVIGRLEQIGFDSLQTLAKTDVDGIVKRIAAMLGTTCWRNSPQARAAIAGAIAAAETATQPPKRS
ncbi:MAG: helix-hairpin-helix domain-containing protein [Lysobacter sp.]|nr:helix-hairpin-helix domain-containing protein [Lysobacter sp.]